MIFQKNVQKGDKKGTFLTVRLFAVIVCILRLSGKVKRLKNGRIEGIITVR